MTNETTELIINEYLSGTKITEMISKFNLSKYILTKTLKKNNVVVKNTTNQIDENYFENIDSSDKAYWLGLLYADGYISEFKTRKGKQVTEYKFSLGLSGEDDYLINEFREDLKSNHKIVIVQAQNKARKIDGKIINREKQTRLDIYNKKMFNDLCKLGLEPRKSQTCKLPEIIKDSEYFSDFVRGYFDGDGWVYGKSKIGMIGSVEFIDDLVFELEKRNIQSTVKLEKRSDNMKYITIRSNSKKSFFEFLYPENKNRYMKRKYDYYNSLIISQS